MRIILKHGYAFMSHEFQATYCNGFRSKAPS